MALADARRGIKMFQQEAINVPILGLVENMSYFTSKEDPKNKDVLIYINGSLYPRSEAKISVYDSGFLLGDGVWEGIRLHQSKLIFINEHLDRLFESIFNAGVEAAKQIK